MNNEVQLVQRPERLVKFPFSPKKLGGTLAGWKVEEGICGCSKAATSQYEIRGVDLYCLAYLNSTTTIITKLSKVKLKDSWFVAVDISHSKCQ